MNIKFRMTAALLCFAASSLAQVPEIALTPHPDF